MDPSTKTAERGFTLIEISIVLVIIGLLVGGVLAGQDLIRAAAARSQITQIEKFSTAVNTFRSKYGGIPGDIGAADAARFGFPVGNACVGGQGQRDGNGLLDAGPAPYIYGQGVGETGLFWQDLSVAKLIEGSFSGAPGVPLDCVNSSFPNGPDLAYYFPIAKIGSSNYVFVYETNGANWFGVGAITAIVGGNAVQSANTITVHQAYSIDKKVDDGLPTTGNVQATTLCCNNNIAVSTESYNDDDTMLLDTPATCYLWNLHGTSGYPATRYSEPFNGGSSAACALSFKFQ